MARGAHVRSSPSGRYALVRKRMHVPRVSLESTFVKRARTALYRSIPRTPTTLTHVLCALLDLDVSHHAVLVLAEALALAAPAHLLEHAEAKVGRVLAPGLVLGVHRARGRQKCLSWSSCDRM